MFISKEEKHRIVDLIGKGALKNETNAILIDQHIKNFNLNKDQLNRHENYIDVLFKSIQKLQDQVKELEARPLTLTLPALRKINEDREKHRKSKQSGYMKKWYAEKQAKAATAADTTKE